MRGPQRFTRRPFTVAVCAACGEVASSDLLPKLRELIRDCPHGMLVATQCLLGELSCAVRGPDHGVMLLLQPCNAQRVPTASVVWIGPLRTAEDTAAACQWISAGVWSRDDLPQRLRADVNLTRSSRRN